MQYETEYKRMLRHEKYLNHADAKYKVLRYAFALSQFATTLIRQRGLTSCSRSAIS